MCRLLLYPKKQRFNLDSFSLSSNYSNYVLVKSKRSQYKLYFQTFSDSKLKEKRWCNSTPAPSITGSRISCSKLLKCTYQLCTVSEKFQTGIVHYQSTLPRNIFVKLITNYCLTSGYGVKLISFSFSSLQYLSQYESMFRFKKQTKSISYHDIITKGLIWTPIWHLNTFSNNVFIVFIVLTHLVSPVKVYFSYWRPGIIWIYKAHPFTFNSW